jgi:acetolactate synthase-1/2/3 large subunit
MRVFQAIADTLVAEGVTDAFTFLSRDIAKLVAELELRGVRIHSARHEHVAVNMADGYARASGRLGVAIIGEGVGLTNALNALITATKAQSQVLVLVGELPGASMRAGALQRKHLDQRALLEVLEVSRVDLTGGASAPADVRAAVELASRRPVVVSLPEPIMEADAGREPSIVPVPATVGEPDHAAIDAIIARLRGAPTGRTVVLAGRGVVRANAVEPLRRLGEATGAILGTSIHARGAFNGDAYSVGVVGGLATPLGKELLAQAEVVLAFGASLSFDQTQDGAIFGAATVIQVDRDPSAFGRYAAPDLALVGEVRTTAEALLARLGGERLAGPGYRTPDVAAAIDAFSMAETFTDESGPEGLDMRALTVALDRLLPRERTVVVDGGSCKYYPIAFLPSPDAHAFLWPTEYGAIGISVGAAMGAAVARPDRLTVLCAGDGGLMMTLADLDTAVREGLAVVVVVYDNGGLVAEVNYLRDNGYSGEVARYRNPSFADVAAALGYEAVTITDLAQLEALAPRLAGIRSPLLLHCRVMERRLRPDYVSHARRRALAASAASN